MKHLSTLAIGLLIGTAAFQFSNSASGQSEGGWVTLVDGNKMGDWDEVGKANWAMKDGALTADKLDGKDPSYLVSKNSYKDFQIKAEFWTDEEANSGIFIRCDEAKKIDAKICYEVNIFDKRPDPTYGTGAIVDVAKVDPMPKAAGKWNTYEITAQGPHLVVVLNGQKTADVQDSKHLSGTARAWSSSARSRSSRCRTVRLKHCDEFAKTDARSLSLWERVGVRGYDLSSGRNPHLCS
jgi:hypothetical protein